MSQRVIGSSSHWVRSGKCKTCPAALGKLETSKAHPILSSERPGDNVMSARLCNIASVRRIFIAGALSVASLLVITGISGVTAAQERKQAEPTARVGSNPELVSRGKYLVEEVAMCGNCHTPRHENGELDLSRRLTGTPLFMQPAHPMSDWPILAPRLAGTPPANDAAMITLLTTGIWTDGKRLRQPMPQFRMTRSDAEAVVAYLKSL